MERDKENKNLILLYRAVPLILLIAALVLGIFYISSDLRKRAASSEYTLDENLDRELAVDIVGISSSTAPEENTSDREPVNRPPEKEEDKKEEEKPEKENSDEEKKDDDKPAAPTQEEIKVGDVVIVTDLKSAYAFSSEPYTLTFTAYVKDDPKHPIKFLGNKSIKSLGGNQYSIDLLYGNNTFQILVEYGKDVSHFTYNIEGKTELADRDNPVKGDPNKTPGVHNSLSSDLETNGSGQYMTNTSDYTFRVSGTDSEGNKIYSDHMKVYVDGVLYDRPVTFNSMGEYEYSLEFEKPVVGNTVVRTISIVTWDDKGNSIYQEFEIEYTYEAVDTVTGEIYVALDLTAVGLDMFDLGSIEIKAGHTIDEYILNILLQNGFTYRYEGGYLYDLYNANGLFAGAYVPYVLELCIDKEIERGGLVRWNNEWHGPNADDGTVLGDGDFTNKSGWMYCINDYNYPGTGISERKPNPGDRVYLRYTINGGKELGANAVTYCCVYLNGVEYINHVFSDGECIHCGLPDPNYVPPETE